MILAGVYSIIIYYILYATRNWIIYAQNPGFILIENNFSFSRRKSFRVGGGNIEECAMNARKNFASFILKHTHPCGVFTSPLCAQLNPVKRAWNAKCSSERATKKKTKVGWWKKRARRMKMLVGKKKRGNGIYQRDTRSLKKLTNFSLSGGKVFFSSIFFIYFF